MSLFRELKIGLARKKAALGAGFKKPFASFSSDQIELGTYMVLSMLGFVITPCLTWGLVYGLTSKAHWLWAIPLTLLYLPFVYNGAKYGLALFKDIKTGSKEFMSTKGFFANNLIGVGWMILTGVMGFVAVLLVLGSWAGFLGLCKWAISIPAKLYRFITQFPQTFSEKNKQFLEANPTYQASLDKNHLQEKLQCADKSSQAKRL